MIVVSGPYHDVGTVQSRHSEQRDHVFFLCYEHWSVATTILSCYGGSVIQYVLAIMLSYVDMQGATGGESRNNDDWRSTSLAIVMAE